MAPFKCVCALTVPNITKFIYYHFSIMLVSNNWLRHFILTKHYTVGIQCIHCIQPVHLPVNLPAHLPVHLPVRLPIHLPVRLPIRFPLPYYFLFYFILSIPIKKGNFYLIFNQQFTTHPQASFRQTDPSNIIIVNLICIESFQTQINPIFSLLSLALLNKR